jgi:hypothetical protein
LFVDLKLIHLFSISKSKGTAKILVDEVPFVLYNLVGETPDPDSDEFKALLALVINVGMCVNEAAMLSSSL